MAIKRKKRKGNTSQCFQGISGTGFESGKAYVWMIQFRIIVYLLKGVLSHSSNGGKLEQRLLAGQLPTSAMKAGPRQDQRQARESGGASLLSSAGAGETLV